MSNGENTPRDLSILLQFAKFSKGFHISDFDEFVQEYVGIEKLDFFGRLAYPNQWQMRVTDPAVRERLIRIGRTRIKNRSCWMYPLNQQEIRGFIHWLPNTVTNDQLTEMLKQYGDVLFVETQERTIKGQIVKSDSRYYGLMLPHGTIKEDLPHFLKINGFKCLVIVRGRELACFHCKEVGHRRVECSKFKEKLISYCNRESNTAQPRLKPRGRRHLNVEIKSKVEFGKTAIASSADIVCFEKKVCSEEDITECQPDLETEEYVSEGQVHAEWVETSATTATSFSETKPYDILENLQQLQQKTVEDISLSLKNHEKGLAETLNVKKISVSSRYQRPSITSKTMDTSANLELEAQTTAEISEKDFNTDTYVKETEETEILPHLLTMYEDKECSPKPHELAREKSEEIAEPTTRGSINISDTMRSVLQMLKRTKQIAAKTLENTFNQLEESVTEVIETASKSATVTSQTSGKDEMSSEFAILKRVPEYFESIFENLEEEIAGLSSAGIDTKLTRDHIHFHKQILQKAKESVGETFRNLALEIEEEIEPAYMATKSSIKSKLPTKTLTKLDTNIEQLKKSVNEVVTRFDKEKADILDIEIPEQQSTVDKTPKEMIGTESDPVAIAQGIDKTVITFESSVGGKTEVDKNTLTESQGLESYVSDATEKYIEELLTNINQIFTSVRAKDGLLSETRTVLNQMGVEINEVFEEVKNKLKANI